MVEDRLLDLSGVLRAGDDDLSLLEVDHHAGLGVDAVALGVELEHGRRQDREVGLAVVLELLLAGANEHVADEERLAGELADDEVLPRVPAVSAGEPVDDEEVARGEVVADLPLDGVVGVLADGHVDGAPRDLVVDVLGVDDEAVLGGAARVATGGDGEGAGVGEHALPARERLLHEYRRGRVDEDRTRAVLDPCLCETIVDHGASS